MIEFVKGGLDSSNPNRYNYIQGRILDTRLMGVVCMHLEYEDRLTDQGNLHLYFYYDYEETGLETVTLMRTKNAEEAASKETQTFAGLGGGILQIDEKQAHYYIRWMVAKNTERKLPLPRELSEIKWILEEKESLDDLAIAAFERSICVGIRTDYGVVNYYLMRCFGRDLADGAKALLAPHLDNHPLIPRIHSTFLMNKMTDVTEQRNASDGTRVYRCESITLEDEAVNNQLVLSEIWVKDKEVVYAEKISSIVMGDYESAVYLNREEYVTVVQPISGLETTLPLLEEYTLSMTRNSYAGGTLFIQYNLDNRHVEKKTYRLNDDVNVLFFLTDTGQLVLCGYNVISILNGEAHLASSPLKAHYEISNRYHFVSALFYDFLESGIPDFADYMSLLEFET